MTIEIPSVPFPLRDPPVPGDKGVKLVRRMNREEQAGDDQLPGKPSLGYELNRNWKNLSVPIVDFMPRAQYRPLMWDLIGSQFDSDGPDVAVEVGSRRGLWANGLLDRTSETRLWCIDLWHGAMGDANLRCWERRVSQWLFTRVFPLRGPSDQWATIFPFVIDLLYIDGDHGKKQARRDMHNWIPLVRKGGLIMGHDYNIRSVQIVVDDFFKKWKVRLSTGPLGPKRVISWWAVKP